MHQAYVVAVLMYMQQKRGHTKKDDQRIMRTLLLLAVKWHDHRTNEEIKRTLQRDETVCNRKLQLLGRVCRLQNARRSTTKDIS